MLIYAYRRRGLLSIGYRSYWSLIHPIKSNGISSSSGCVNTTVCMYYMDPNKRIEKKIDGNYTRILQAILKEILEATSHETIAVWLLTSHLKNHPNKRSKAYGILLEKQGWTHKWRSSMGPLHMDVPVLTDQREFIYISSEDTECSLEDLPGTIDDRNGRRERESQGNLCC